jgi:hypothetical protein
MEALEPRRLMSATGPTDLEQYMLELVNRARSAPAAEAARYGIDLNEGLPTGTISVAAKQPVVFNPSLIDSARGHSQWMIDNDVFAHVETNGSNPGDRMVAAAYGGAGTFGWGENIEWRGQKPTSLPPVSTTAAEHQDLFVDAGISERGHRTNLLNPSYKEIGVGTITGDFQTYNAFMTTEDFGYKTAGSFLTGVAFTDAVTADNFYTPGEGIGGVTVTAVRAADGAAFTTTTWASGGYTLPLPAGAYAVTATGGKLATPVRLADVTIGSLNVKRDIRPDGAPPTPAPDPVPAPSPPPPPTPVPTPDPTPEVNPPPATSPIQPPTPSPVGVVKGSAWDDLNGNGKRDRGEPPLAGQVAYLDANGNGTPDDGEPTAATAADGSFAFTGLARGAYRVRLITPGGWRVSSPGGDVRDVVVTGPKARKVKSFGLTQAVTISGTVYFDVNANGTADAGEPAFRKAKAFIDLNNDGVRQANEPAVKVSKTGTWRFAGLTAGTYAVRLIIKPEYVTTTPTGGLLTIDASSPATDSLDNVLGVSLAASVPGIA